MRVTDALDAAFALLGRALRLAPAAALLSLALVLEGELRWLGLLGVVPLLLARLPGCPACAAGSRTPAAGYRPWPAP